MTDHLYLLLALVPLALGGHRVRRGTGTAHTGPSPGGQNYVIETDCSMKKTQAAAKSHCQALGMTLPMYINDAELTWLAQRISRADFAHCWMDYTDSATEGSFLDSNNRPFSSTGPGWLQGQPDNQQGNEDCVAFVAIAGGEIGYNDLGCARLHNVVCMKSATGTVSVGPSPSNRRYLIEKNLQTQQADAKSRCEALGMTLPRFINDAEMTYLAQSLTQAEISHIWMDYTDSATEGTFLDSSGTQYGTTGSAWQTGQPDSHNSREDCVVLSAVTGGGFNDAECTRSFTVVCMKSA